MASTYEKIQNIVVSSGTTITVDFTSISQSYTDLIIVGNFGCTKHSNRSPIRINNDTGNNYSTIHLRGNGSTAFSGNSSNIDSGFMFDNIAIPTSFDGNCVLMFNNYSSTNTYKTFLCRYGSTSRGTAVSVNLWRSTTAISSIQIIAGSGGEPGTNYWSTDSTFTLYGIKAA
jgi:hypothetical protein